MKRIGNLFETMTSFEQLWKAYLRARKGTRLNNENGDFFLNAEKEILQIQRELRTLTYQPKSYQYFKIFDPKIRTISVAAFRDRVVHHALVGVLEPIYERCFIFDSYATRKGKGTHKAILRAQSFLRKNQWFLKSDIDKYFDSITHQIMFSLLERKIKDTKVLEIARRIISAGGINRKGLPIGNLTSQFFANVYLNHFDIFVKEILLQKHYIRYMDDFVLFSNDKEQLKAAKKEIEIFLEAKLALKLKAKATFLNSRSNGLTFLGKRIYPNLIRIAPANLQRIRKRIKIKEKQKVQGLINEEKFLQSMASYWANLSFGNTYALRQLFLEKGT